MGETNGICLDRGTILGLNDLAIERVEVPEWGGAVYVRMMAGFERDKWETRLIADRNGNGEKLIRSRLVVLTACDASGVRLFSDEDENAIAGKSAAALDRLFEASLRLNRIGQDDQKTLAGN